LSGDKQTITVRISTRKIRSVLMIFGALVLVVACDKVGKPADTITIPLKYRAEILDPLQAVDEATVLVVNFLHRRVYAYDAEGNLGPDLASGEVRRGRQVIIALKPGGPTAIDVVAALHRVQKDANQKWVMEQISRIQALDMTHVEVILSDSPRPPETDWKLAKIKLTLPQCAIFDRADFEARHVFTPFSPYRVEEQTGDRILLKSLDASPKIEFLAMPDETARYFAFREARLDAYEALGIHRKMPFDADLYEPSTMYDLVVLYAAFSAAENSALAQPGLRRAINRRFNRNMLCERTLLGACAGADYPVPPVLSPPPTIAFPEALDYKIPRTTEVVTLFTVSDKERMLIAEYLRDLFHEFNIALQFRIVDLPSMVRESNKGTRGIYLMKWSADYPHAENFLMPLFHSRNAGVGGNRAHIKDEILDSLLDRSDYSVGDVQTIQQRIRILSPWLFIGFQNMQFYRLKKSRLRIPKIYAGWGRSAVAGR
jgi:ABC-type oligopeptide transport system substrate-binding subunit